ncbi:MAG: glycine cleavage system protein GcvH [bacterium]
MSNCPDNLKYTKDHEWVKIEGNKATVGITFFAQDQLGDVVFVELPEVGKELKAHDEFGVVESVKSVSSLYCPLSGKLVEVNAELNNAPQLINEDPYGKAWIMKLEVTKPDEVNSLLSSADYQKQLT